MHYLYAWKIVEHFFIKILFGPWLYFESKIPELQKHYPSPAKALTITVVIFATLVALRLFFKKELEPSLSRFSRTMFQVLFGGAWAGILGGIANEVVSLANNGKMPVAPQEINDYLYRSYLFESRLHAIAGTKTKLFWLCDYITPQFSRAITFLYPDNPLVSPGDLAGAAYFLIAWLTILALVGFGLFAGCRKSHQYAVRRICQRPSP